jgi:hypothetical protein
MAAMAMNADREDDIVLAVQRQDDVRVVGFAA